MSWIEVSFHARSDLYLDTSEVEADSVTSAISRARVAIDVRMPIQCDMKARSKRLFLALTFSLCWFFLSSCILSCYHDHYTIISKEPSSDRFVTVHTTYEEEQMSLFIWVNGLTTIR